MNTKLLFLLGLLLPTLVFSQTYERLSVEFIQNGETLPNALVGGINTPQLSKVDFNNDGIEDLYIFDRAANVHLCFLHDGVVNSTNYTFAPEYAANFPDLEHFVLLRDYNQDGTQDLFAYSDTPGIASLVAFTGYYDENNRIAFKRYETPTEQDFPVLYTAFSRDSETPIYVALNDYPSIDDVDGDGDLDILTFNIAGGFLEYIINRSVERGYGTDSLIYEIADQCWGGFYESGLQPDVSLSETRGSCFDAAQMVESRHAGSTVLSLNLDADCDKEVILGDLSFENLIMLENGGDCQEAWMTSQDVNFPSYDTPAQTALFPASFYLDIDNDGNKDLISAPNNNDNTEDYFNMWFYKNTGSNENPQFELKNRSFLTEETLDFGSGSNPTFFDYNQDGLMDIVVGTVGYFVDSGNRDPRLVLWENIGTPTEPRYELADEDWLDFSQFKSQTWNFTPTFGDLDNDGDEDLLVGDEFGKLFYVENIADEDATFRAAAIRPNYMDVDIGGSSTPHLVDINQDGLLDLLIGERNGNVNYYPNIGTREQAKFQTDATQSPNNQLFGRIDAREPQFITGFSAPVVISDNRNRKVVTGTAKGQLEIYDLNENNFEATFELEQAIFGNIKEGRRSKATFADINQNGKLEVLVGNYRGGLALYSTDLVSDASVSTTATFAQSDLKIYPNPASDRIFWSSEHLRIDAIRLTSVLGQTLLDVNISQTNNALDLPEDLSAGVYYLSFYEDRELISVKKVITE
ncbi:MAG: FG-GAP-like repeat-containing protein [Bacteroidota bacterium]